MVLAIIGALMAMATLSGGDRQAEDLTTRTGEQIRTLFIAYQQEASFQNIDLGVALEGENLHLLSLQDIRTQEVQANKTQEELAALNANPWQAYSGPLKSTLELPIELFLTLKIEGQEIELSEEPSKDGLKPVLLFLSSDEYTPFELSLHHEDDRRFSVVLKGDGFNPPLIEVTHFED